MQYYDPKTDVVFKKIFGAHKNLTISLLNAVLKLEDSENKIKDVRRDVQKVKSKRPLKSPAI
jgi:hypothetical protein